MSSLDAVEAVEGQQWLRRLFRPWFMAKVIAPVLVVGGIYYWAAGGDETIMSGTTVKVTRGPLAIRVVEGGSIAALESQEVKCEVEGATKILSIIEEGYTVTQEDVEKKKLLVELDSKDLREKQTAQELEYQNALSAFTEAKEDYQIQVNQNLSDITAADLAVKFARMDFEKYMGADAANKILGSVKFEEDADVPLPTSDLNAEDNSAEGKEAKPDKAEKSDKSDRSDRSDKTDKGEKKAVPVAAPAPTPPPAAKPAIQVDFVKYADVSALGDGEAGQKLRKLEDGLLVSKRELGLSSTKFEGTKRLAEKEFVTKNDLENEQLTVEKNQIALKSSETDKDLFIKYEFLKTAEKYFSDYVEALRKLVRAKKLATAKLAQSEAKLKSTEARYTLQSQKRKEIREQLGKCKITAERPGLVVYGAGERWRDDDRIEEGATVRQRQKIITIPDMNQMAVEVKIHESVINKVQKGQKAKIRVDSYPDEELTGEVFKVGILPDNEDRWMNPDVKVFVTKVSIDGIQPWLKPQMSAQVEILIQELPDVLSVPIQAVVPSNGERVCYVSHLGGPERRIVETGESNDQYIEIKSGLKEGEEVFLRAPVATEESADKDEQQNGTEKAKGKGAKPEKKAAEDKPKPPEPPAPKGK